MTPARVGPPVLGRARAYRGGRHACAAPPGTATIARRAERCARRDDAGAEAPEGGDATRSPRAHADDQCLLVLFGRGLPNSTRDAAVGEVGSAHPGRRRRWEPRRAHVLPTQAGTAPQPDRGRPRCAPRRLGAARPGCRRIRQVGRCARRAAVAPTVRRAAPTPHAIGARLDATACTTAGSSWAAHLPAPEDNRGVSGRQRAHALVQGARC